MAWLRHLFLSLCVGTKLIILTESLKRLMGGVGQEKKDSVCQIRFHKCHDIPPPSLPQYTSEEDIEPSEAAGCEQQFTKVK